MPALLTRTSQPPNSSFVALNMALMSSSSAMLALIAIAFPPDALIASQTYG